MKTVRYYNLIICLCFLSACHSPQKKNTKVFLSKTDQKIEIPIDDNTELYTRALFHFVDTTTGVEYISLENIETIEDYNKINFYRLDSCKLSHTIKIDKNGPNGVHAFMGHTVFNLDNIFLSGFNRNIIFQINGKGKILKKIEYETDNKGNRVTEFWASSLMYKNFTIIGSKIYVPQFPLKNTDIVGKDFDTFPLCVTIDTVDNSVETLPLTYPHLWEQGGNISHNAHYSFIFDGKQFIYAFQTEEDIIVTPDHIHTKKYCIKSKYMEKVQNQGYNPGISMGELIKKNAGVSYYGNFVYDKYRNVYYRFAYLPTEDINTSVEYIFCRRKFSIIVLNDNFEIIGETLFPENIYAPALFFINKDGLYLSENHIDNPNASENLLVFRQFQLVSTTPESEE